MHIFDKYWEYGCILLYRYLPSVQSFFREPTTPHVHSIVFFCAAQQQCDLKLCKLLSFFRKLFSWVLFCAQQWQKSPNIDEYTQSSGTGGIHTSMMMMIKKMLLLPLLLAAPAARPNHDIIQKPNRHEGKYNLKK